MRNLLRIPVLAITVLIVVLGFPTLSHDQTPDPPTTHRAVFTVSETQQDDVPISRDRAVKIASGLLGIDPQGSYPARLGLATDNTVPFLMISDRLVWEIVFEDLIVSFTDADGTEKPKQEFSILTCLLDARTGALLKVSSMTPAVGAVRSEHSPGELEKEMTNGKMSFAALDAAQLTQVTIKPLIPSLKELEKGKRDTIQPAKQLVAYFGLLTDRARPSRHIVDRPYWIIMTGGLQRPMRTPSGEHKASDACFWVDACTGKLLIAFILGR